MNGRYRVYLALIALLAAANAGRWVFAKASVNPASRERVLLADDFRIRVDVPGTVGHGRDLFSASGARNAADVEERGIRRKPAVRAAPAPVSAPDAAEVMAASGLGRLRLLGVVIHGGKRQAYLAQDRENCIASAGDTVFGQYAIERVSVDAVDLRDIKSNLTRRIPVSGK